VHPDGTFEEILIRQEGIFNKAGKFGGFLQVSRGMRVEYENGRLKSLLLNGQPLEDDKIYTLATSEFTAGGGDGLVSFCASEESVLGPNMTALFVEAVKALRIIDVDTENRIK
ncbi:MAG TPA: 5'-nucleotidase C-terminal domain-containing protein, partial [Candidatus Wallbacteria bacterium]|nr:5'-nucleotidase C-terminal domain-containing protein [Candidatus Wallbacteria bacterium]